MTEYKEQSFINLSQGKVATVDKTDYAQLAQHRWAYRSGCASRRDGKSFVRMHRIILNAQPGEEVDHINGDTLDNRRANLRLCTHAENQRNRRRPKGPHTSPYRGVYPMRKRWTASIKYNQKPIYLGMFDTPEEAALAYNKAAREFFGEFARFNEVESPL